MINRWLIFTLLIFTCSSGYGDITLVVQSSASTTNASVLSLASPSMTDTNTNDLVVISCQADSSNAKVVFGLATTNSGLTVALGTSSANTANYQNGGSGFWYACTGAGGFSAKTFTCNWATTPAAGGIGVKTYSGTGCTNATPSLGIGKVNECSYTSGTTVSCAVTTTGNNSLVVGNGDDWTNAATISPGSLQTLWMNNKDTVNGGTTWDGFQNSTTPSSGSNVTMSISGITSGDVGNDGVIEILASGAAAPVLGSNKNKRYDRDE